MKIELGLIRIFGIKVRSINNNAKSEIIRSMERAVCRTKIQLPRTES